MDATLAATAAVSEIHVVKFQLRAISGCVRAQYGLHVRACACDCTPNYAEFYGFHDIRLGVSTAAPDNK